MDNRNDWKRASGPGASSRSEKYGNERRGIRDGKNSSPRMYEGNSYNKSDNYGNRIQDTDYNYERGGSSGYDSGYIDLNSAVDSVPAKRKRKRIVKDNNTSSVPDKPYQKVVLKRKVGKKPLPPLKKKIKPVAPLYPDVVFDKPIRLNRFISNTGLCSRREADEYIKQGLIKVNGEVVTEMGVKVNPGDEVCFKDKILSSQRKIYLLLNKPKGFVTSVDEPQGKKIVMDLVRSACKERIYPVGRLDKMTTGVLLFTNDGDLSLKLTHPSNRMRKVYQVTLDKPLSGEDLEKLAKGIELEDGFIAFDSVAYTDQDNHTQIGVEIHSGKNRIVRRMFEAVGYKVMKLDRVYFAGLTRKGLKRGKWRFLSPEEVAFLKMMPSG
ncbi:MAG: rRNA pseudouridine synthase [Bacteroidales bacterium]|jgi:23S rRNA pseudouridine2605 synthase|nr:rRNA pseudouridine synthase [Bacteroidales bacterium]